MRMIEIERRFAAIAHGRHWHETDDLWVRTNVCSWWKSGHAAGITAKTDFDPKRVMRRFFLLRRTPCDLGIEHAFNGAALPSIATNSRRFIVAQPPSTLIGAPDRIRAPSTPNTPP